jgi:PAS domain S-box-containing protein
MLNHNEAAATPSAGDSHVVRVFEDDDVLMNEVAEFLDVALRCAGLALVIATPQHRAALHRRLAGFGTKPGGWSPGNLIMLDAAETLALFMVDGSPHPQKFEEAVVPALKKATPGGAVHAFGEMVALLCESGNYDGALALEGLWNNLARRRQFSLFCAYHQGLFASDDQAQPFRRVCEAHSSVLSLLPGVGGPAEADPAATIMGLRQQALALQVEVERRKEAERTLRQRERELAEFLDNACEGIHKVANDGTVLYANRAELDMLGYRWDEYVGRNIAEFYFDQAHIGDILARLQRGDVLRDEPALLRCKDGSRKPVSIHSNAYFEDGELRYTRCFTRDASERLGREQAIEQRNNVILQAPIAAALLSAPDLRYELANDAYCEMVGRRNIVGKTFAQAFPELPASATETLLQEVLRTGQSHVSEEWPAAVDAGEGPRERFYKLRLQPMQDASGPVQGIIAVAVDITDQVHARQIVEQSYAEREKLLDNLRDANRAKDEFLAMLGHELRNPLSPIVTALQLMRMKGDTGTSREQAIIHRQVQHMVRLIDDLLDISRITRGKLVLKSEQIELSLVLMKAVEQASPLLEQRSHRLEIDVEPGLQCYCDTVRMAQVVANLLTNAARYTDVGGEIQLSARRDSDGRVVVSVQDNGSGISPEMLRKVFDLFYQGERGVDRAEGGLGIGLALVRSLVTLHGGSVDAFSEGQGKGSKFVVKLPGSPVHPPPVASKATALRPARPGRRVLLVDDNVDAADTLAEWLRSHDHEVTVFHEPASALARLEALRPDIAILDIGLPVMDGYELGRRVRQACGDSCMLIALTGYGQDEDKTRSRAAQFNHHLVKPVDTAEVLRVMGEQDLPA